MPNTQPVILEDPLTADRRRLWIEVYIAHKRGDTSRYFPEDAADEALARFDTRFPESKAVVYMPPKEEK